MTDRELRNLAVECWHLHPFDTFKFQDERPIADEIEIETRGRTVWVTAHMWDFWGEKIGGCCISGLREFPADHWRREMRRAFTELQSLRAIGSRATI